MQFGEINSLQGRFDRLTGNIGKLGIPRMEPEQFAAVHNFNTRLHGQYTKLVEEMPRGAQFLSKLRDDPRAVKLEGKYISTGSHTSQFDMKTLVMWYLWHANEEGEEEAQRQLDAWLENDEVEVLSTLWVLGIEADQVIPLEDGYSILPAKDMPDSVEKERYLQIRMGCPVPYSPALPK